MSQSDVMVAHGDVRKQIRDRKTALQSGDTDGYISLLRMLHASLEVDKLLVEIKRGSFAHNVELLSVSQKLQLMNLAERWCASDSEMRRIIKSLSEATRDSRGRQDLKAARARLKFRNELVGSPVRAVPLVPLGAHCLAWTLPNRWGMRPPEDVGRLFNPFSLAAHKPAYLARTVAEDFGEYLDPGMLMATVSQNGFEMVARKDGSALWNHCVGPYWTGSKFSRFTTAMEHYLDRFRREGLAEGSFRVFIVHMPNAISDESALLDLERIAEALRKRLKSPHGVLMIDTTQRGGTALEPIAVDGMKALVRAPIPAGYKWPAAEYYNSPEGLKFESAIVKNIESVVSTWVPNNAEAG